MTSKQQAREIICGTDPHFWARYPALEEEVVKVVAAALAEPNQEIERLKQRVYELENLMLPDGSTISPREMFDEWQKVAAQRDALYQAALVFCHSIESRLKHGRASRKEIALERAVRAAALAAGKGSNGTG